MTLKRILIPLLATTFAGLAPLSAENRDAENYIEAVRKINVAHARKPGKTTEAELSKTIPRSAVVGLARLLKEQSSDEVSEALVNCGEAALDIANLDHFQRIRKRLLEIDKDAADRLGDAALGTRFLVRTLGAFEDGFLQNFVEITDGILDAYDEVFGFAEWSKVPGKLVRIRVHLEEQIKRPPHFAPQFPFHSEIDLPVVQADLFRSPTTKGQMMFYGLCHEFGHLIAMWGDRKNQEDHHAWAHFTGVVVVEHMANTAKYKKLLTNLRDVRWRSLTIEKKNPANQVPPSTANRASVIALLTRIHDLAGPKSLGNALNHMAENQAGHRINHVRYYSFDDLKKALVSVIEDRDKQREVRALFP